MNSVVYGANLKPASNRGWELRLFGKFALTDPSGALVRLPDRKTEGLLAILALSREYGIERQAVADILWPLATPKNLSNLRQALSVLRRALGSEVIESSVHHCRLASTFNLVSDYERPELRGVGGFMPGHDGDWFDDARLDSILQEGSPEERSTASGRFFETLRWFSLHDPRGMYALLSVKPSMGRSIPYNDLAGLLEEPNGKQDCLGWYSYWRGTVEDDLEVCVRHLRLALRIARATNDLLLASEACMELGKAYARTGRLEKALKLCDIADVVAAKSSANNPTTNALRLRGTVLLNWHDPVGGLELFLRAEERIEDPLELVYTQNARAFFEASLGFYERAEVTLAKVLALSRNLGHFRVGVVSATTRAILLTAGGSQSEAVNQLAAVATECYSSSVTQFGVYAEEMLAKLYLADGDRGGAAQRMQSARRGRVTAQMSVTPLEVKRVAAVTAT